MQMNIYISRRYQMFGFTLRGLLCQLFNRIIKCNFQSSGV